MIAGVRDRLGSWIGPGYPAISTKFLMAPIGGAGRDRTSPHQGDRPLPGWRRFARFDVPISEIFPRCCLLRLGAPDCRVSPCRTAMLGKLPVLAAIGLSWFIWELDAHSPAIRA